MNGNCEQFVVRSESWPVVNTPAAWASYLANIPTNGQQIE